MKHYYLLFLSVKATAILKSKYYKSSNNETQPGFESLINIDYPEYSSW